MKTNRRKLHPRARAARRKQALLQAKRWCYAILTCVAVAFLFASVASFFKPQVIIQINNPDGFVPPTITVENTPEKVVILPVNLEGDESTKVEYIKQYLASKGESEIDRWIKIFKAESGFDQNSVAPTYWHKCDRKVVVTLWGYQQPANDIIELRDYPNGVWQATCEEFGANTIQSGRSAGLSHIIERTWDWLRCEGDRMNWADNIDCSIKIRNTLGWSAWSTN